MNAAKPKFTALLLLLIIVSLFTGSLPCSAAAADGALVIKDFNIQPGSDESQLNFSWYSEGGRKSCFIQVGKKSEMSFGSVFPANYQTFSGLTTDSELGARSNKVTVTGLEANTEYLFRPTDGSSYGNIYPFKTGSFDKYSALFITDLHLGSSDTDSTFWASMLDRLLAKHPSTALLLSGGDQVNSSVDEAQYDGLLSAARLPTIPFAPTVGNNDNRDDSALFGQHFNLPNKSDIYGLTPAAGDYWFTYGSALYIVLNTYNSNAQQHDAFMAQATAANPDAKWKLVMLHHPLYGSGTSSQDETVMKLRSRLYPLMDKYAVDVVLTGHDHTYTRTFTMYDGTAQKKVPTDDEGRMLSPDGTIYLDGNSISAKKFNPLTAEPQDYAAFRYQPNTATFTNIEVDKFTLTLTSYRTDNFSVIDTFTIYKSFIDVPGSAWYSNAVNYIAYNGIASGTGNNRFSPDSQVTRGQFMAMLLKAYDIAPDSAPADNFADAGDTYYTGYLSAAKRLKIAAGTGDNMFLPESFITRQDMLTLIYKTLEKLYELPQIQNNIDPTDFSDYASIDSYAIYPVTYMLKSGIVNGNGQLLDPKGLSTRAQLAQILYNLLKWK